MAASDYPCHCGKPGVQVRILRPCAFYGECADHAGPDNGDLLDYSEHTRPYSDDQHGAATEAWLTAHGLGDPALGFEEPSYGELIDAQAWADEHATEF